MMMSCIVWDTWIQITLQLVSLALFLFSCNGELNHTTFSEKYQEKFAYPSILHTFQLQCWSCVCTSNKYSHFYLAAVAIRQKSTASQQHHWIGPRSFYSCINIGVIHNTWKAMARSTFKYRIRTSFHIVQSTYERERTRIFGHILCILCALWVFDVCYCCWLLRLSFEIAVQEKKHKRE